MPATLNTSSKTSQRLQVVKCSPKAPARAHMSKPPQSQGVQSVRPVSCPAFQVRIAVRDQGMVMSIWQTPSLGTLYLKAPLCIAKLQGRVLDLIEPYILRLLKQAGVRLVFPAQQRKRVYCLDEPQALRLALLFRTLAPLRSREAISAVAKGIAAMPDEEAAYWLGMALYRPNPQRVLKALRVLLTDFVRSPAK